MMATPKKLNKRKPQKRSIERIPTRNLVRSIREDMERERQKREKEQAGKD
jgi:hypothetical protein